MHQLRAALALAAFLTCLLAVPAEADVVPPPEDSGETAEPASSSSCAAGAHAPSAPTATLVLGAALALVRRRRPSGA